MGDYAAAPNSVVTSSGGAEFRYRETGPGEALVLFQHFRRNLDNWDPELIDELAPRRIAVEDKNGTRLQEPLAASIRLENLQAF